MAQEKKKPACDYKLLRVVRSEWTWRLGTVMPGHSCAQEHQLGRLCALCPTPETVRHMLFDGGLGQGMASNLNQKWQADVRSVLSS